VFINLLLILITLLAAFSVFLLFFLRDPERIPPTGDVILCPADGTVMGIVTEEGWDKIIIFMNPLNVHVQWVPYPGKVVSVERIKGPALAGFLTSASKNNQVVTTIETRLGKMIVKQIVGILVRRIQPYLQPGAEIKLGQRLGRIIFGSRVELWLPQGKAEIKVRAQQKVLAGLTIAAIPKL
jgi:phosphatidylserine decarboxylase